MKKIYSILAVAAIAATGFTSCEDMMDTDTTTYRYENGVKFDTPADSLYSALGILTQLQAIGERYVLFGELRGDLVSVTDEADFSLREISEFNLSPDNEYLSMRDYYSVINNCNYALARIDTMTMVNTLQVLLPEYAAIRTMRAWTYLQMGLNFGTVKYITEPILSLEESLRDFPSVGLDELVPKLIADMAPFANHDLPYYGNIDGLNSNTLFVQPRLLLGDLYLYNNEYENAAAMYYSYIEKTRTAITSGNGNAWQSSSQDGANVNNLQAYRNEAVSSIMYSSEAREYHPNLVNLTYNTLPSMVPAAWWVEEMNDIAHYHVDNLSNNVITGYLQGDLRGMLRFRGGLREQSSAFGNESTGVNAKSCLITKFINNADSYSSITSPDNDMFADRAPSLIRMVVTCRVPHVYLRYAEAVNRAGKPTLAFAVLKYGLNREYMTLGQPTGDDDADAAITDTPVIDPAELADGKPWTNFAVLDLPNNGTAMRGRGLGIRLDGSGYVIPGFETAEETIEFVENEILREMAAETAFEGNRFFDLLRVSHHRADHPALLADKIAARAADPDAMRARLRDSNNWWIKK